MIYIEKQRDSISFLKDGIPYSITFTNGAKLTLDVFNDTIIDGSFEVALSSQFEIK
jgi:hypothetical protein